MNTDFTIMFSTKAYGGEFSEAMQVQDVSVTFISFARMMSLKRFDRFRTYPGYM